MEHISLDDIKESLADFEIEENNWPHWLLINTNIVLNEDNPVILKLAIGEDIPTLSVSLFSTESFQYEDEHICDLVDLEETLSDFMDMLYSQTLN